MADKIRCAYISVERKSIAKEIPQKPSNVKEKAQNKSDGLWVIL